jgi:hypothetical protein
MGREGHRTSAQEMKLLGSAIISLIIQHAEATVVLNQTGASVINTGQGRWCVEAQLCPFAVVTLEASCIRRGVTDTDSLGGGGGGSES